jgi:hypothetical protein
MYDVPHGVEKIQDDGTSGEFGRKRKLGKKTRNHKDQEYEESTEGP